MSRERPLRGACSCGRNRYVIVVPESAVEAAEVYFDSSSENRRNQATPLAAWLRIPLSWYSSHTQSFFPDESHALIRRTFIPHHDPHCKRNFCGYCGTSLSYWTERPAEEAEYLNVTLGSLLSEDLKALQDLNLLPEDIEPESVHKAEQLSALPSSAGDPVAPNELGLPHTKSQRRGTTGDLSWFEEMIDGSRLGRAQKTRRGVGITEDGGTTVQWEVTEWQESGSSGEMHSPAPKRKIGDLALDDDASMRG